MKTNDLKDTWVDFFGICVSGLMKNYSSSRILHDEKSRYELIDKNEVIDIIKDTRDILFPFFFDNMEEYNPTELLKKLKERLMAQILIALRSRSDENDEEEISEEAEKICQQYIIKLPEIQKMLLHDVEAAFEGDPAAVSYEEIIYSYPGFWATMVYRIAHILYGKVPMLPRIMTEYVHSRTGIDISPGAEIDEYFFIDHGTGVVIGETATIGKHVKIYQGVTLGAISTYDGRRLKDKKRHPTIEDNVVIYSGASVLGGNTIIGENSVIGGNAFVTKSVQPGTKVI